MQQSLFQLDKCYDVLPVNLKKQLTQGQGGGNENIKSWVGETEEKALAGGRCSNSL
jgi:hypothetical protein